MTGRSLDDDERLLLAAVGLDGAPLESLAGRAGRTPAAVAEVFQRLLRDGLLTAPDGVTVRLTDEGRRALVGASARGGQPDLRPAVEEVGQQVRHVGSAIVGRLRDRSAASEATRRGFLASDADRDAAVHLLAQAFSVGRLSSADLEHRTGQALAARTHGELDDLLAGLGGYRMTVPIHPWRKGVFGVVAFLTSPFALLGALLLAFGSDRGDHVGGAMMLVILLPGLVALWRWAWPGH